MGTEQSSQLGLLKSIQGPKTPPRPLSFRGERAWESSRSAGTGARRVGMFPDHLQRHQIREPRGPEPQRVPGPGAGRARADTVPVPLHTPAAGSRLDIRSPGPSRSTPPDLPKDTAALRGGSSEGCRTEGGGRLYKNPRPPELRGQREPPRMAGEATGGRGEPGPESRGLQPPLHGRAARLPSVTNGEATEFCPNAGWWDECPPKASRQ